MAYTKIIFQNSPSTATPLNAQNLNHMDDQIAENDRRLNELATAGVVNTFNSRTGNVTSEKGDYDINQIVASDGQEGYIPVWRNSGTEQEPDWGFAMEEMGGSGHEILDADGTLMAQEDALQFADAFLTDDSVNGRTIVENIKEVASADYSSETEDGMYLIPDGEGAVIGPASDDKVEVVADGVKTWKQLYNELYGQIDTSKLTNNTRLEQGGQLFTRINDDTSSLIFVRSVVSQDTYGNQRLFNAQITLNSTASALVSLELYQNNTNSYDDRSNDQPSNGTKITLYYGNKKATVDLQTTANRCWMSNGESVESAINSISYKKAGFAGTTSAAGLLPLTGYEYLDGYRILCVESCTLENVTYTIAHGTTPNYIVFNSIGGQSVANQNVTVVFYYIRV